MAAKKFYAVRRGRNTGIFNNWEDCKASVEGYPEASYKGFPTKEEALAFLGRESFRGSSDIERPQKQQYSSEDRLLVYVDGSYDHSLKTYAFGCVFLLQDGIYLAYGNGNRPESLKSRNVTGEMLGAMYAVKTAMANGYKEVELCYDYEGIEKWVTGEWKSKTVLTAQYAAFMRKWGETIKISFTKVAAHSNIKYNELADKTAKRGLTEGNGIPAIGSIKELERLAGEEGR